MKKLGMLLMAALLLAALLTPALAATLPEDLQSIEDNAFEGDAALTGRLVLPQGTKTVGSRAFAGTGLYALVIPEGCETVVSDVLENAHAAYILFEDADTVIDGPHFDGVEYVFGPAQSMAAELPGFYASEDLTEIDGIIYTVTEGEVLPLCAVDGTAAAGTATVPKLLDGKPLRSLDGLLGCTGGVTLRVPGYLTVPDGVKYETYETMSVAGVSCDVEEINAGKPAVWTAEVPQGAYGDVSYLWTITIDVAAYSIITAEPVLTFAPPVEGQCTVTVTAVDSLGDRASAQAQPITVNPAIPVYRALLVGNTYPGSDNELTGCDTDVAAMKTVLDSMPGTPYNVTAMLNLNSSDIKSNIKAAFADACICDVSLFYFSGHGTTSGALVGTGNSILSVSELRSLLDTIPGTKIIIIDACYSGHMIGKSTSGTDTAAFTSAFVSGFSSFGKDNLAENGYIVMTSCTSQQYSQTLFDGKTSFGAFTYGICYGSGYDEWYQRPLGNLPADKDGNGAITLGEAYSMANERVDWLATLATGINQSAQYYGDTSFILWAK